MGLFKKQSNSIHARYGWKRQGLDKNDKKYSAPRHMAGKPLPPMVDLRPKMPPVYDQGQLGSCFPAGTPILMADFNERPIEQIGIGNQIITHNGKRKQVTKIYERKHSGKMYSIEVKGYQYPLTMTEEHPIAVIPNIANKAKYGEFEPGELIWKQAKDLNIKDFVLLPGNKNFSEKLTNPESLQKINLTKFIEDKNIFINEENQNFRTSNSIKNSEIPISIQISKEFARLIGFFLAEGSYRKDNQGNINSLMFTFNRKEENYCQFVIETIKNIFNIEAYIIKSEKRPTVSSVRCDNTTLARVFHTICGEYSLHKKVSPLFFQANQEIRIELLRGWLMGDGTQNPVRYISKKEEARKAVQIEGVTSSLNLHRDMFKLSLMCGLKPGCYIRKQQDHQTAQPRSLLFMSEDVQKIFPEHVEYIKEQNVNVSYSTTAYKRHEMGFLCPISSITITEAEDETVYNLEVEDEHTYIANNIAVHNCTANSSGAAMEFLRMQDHSLIQFQPSRLFTYYNTRVLEETVNDDAGASIRDAIKSVAKYGICSEAKGWWPYSDDDKTFKKKPPQKCYEAAVKHEALNYYAVNQNANEMKTCLSEGHPIVMGFSVYDSFESNEVANTGMVPMPDHTKENLQGGHAVLIVGYDDNKTMLDGSKGCWIVRNSWGDSWGDKGYFYVPYAMFLDPTLADDFWTIRTTNG